MSSLPGDDLLLGIDVGTSFCKAAVVDAAGRERSHGRAPTPWRSIATGAEIDPRSLVGAAVSAAREALEQAPEGAIAAAGITSMAETGVLVDGRGDPVADPIAWHDTRGDGAAQRIREGFGPDQFTARTGLPVSRLCSLSKYLWMKEQGVAVERGVRWFNVAEWVVRSLGGDEVAELSLSSRTGWLDLHEARPWEDILDWAGAPRAFVRQPVLAGTPAGKADDTLPRAQGAVLTVAGHDHDCASVGAGAIRTGDVFDSCGTAEAFVRALPAPVAPADIVRAVDGGVTVGWHVIPEHMAIMGGFESGLALRRFADLLGVSGSRQAELDHAATVLGEGAGGVTVEGVADDRAALIGIPRRPTPAHVWRAAIEAVGRNGRRILNTIESVAGPTERLVVTGGGIRSDAVKTVKLEALGAFVEPAVDEAGARGAALIAGIAAGLYEGVSALPTIDAPEWAPRERDHGGNPTGGALRRYRGPRRGAVPISLFPQGKVSRPSTRRRYSPGSSVTPARAIVVIWASE